MGLAFVLCARPAWATRQVATNHTRAQAPPVTPSSLFPLYTAAPNSLLLCLSLSLYICLAWVPAACFTSLSLFTPHTQDRFQVDQSVRFPILDFSFYLPHPHPPPPLPPLPAGRQTFPLSGPPCLSASASRHFYLWDTQAVGWDRLLQEKAGACLCGMQQPCMWPCISSIASP